MLTSDSNSALYAGSRRAALVCRVLQALPYAFSQDPLACIDTVCGLSSACDEKASRVARVDRAAAERVRHAATMMQEMLSAMLHTTFRTPGELRRFLDPHRPGQSGRSMVLRRCVVGDMQTLISCPLIQRLLNSSWAIVWPWDAKTNESVLARLLRSAGEIALAFLSNSILVLLAALYPPLEDIVMRAHVRMSDEVCLAHLNRSLACDGTWGSHVSGSSSSAVAGARGGACAQHGSPGAQI